ncbi:MAG: hypothetical protein E7369_01930 [Clostridiales bacterium]|nr:hypothetical protein [Clostridiales bacterium]
MKKMGYGKIRGISVVCILLCAVLIGASFITSVKDYRTLINNALGVKQSASSGGEETYAFKSEYKSTPEMLTDYKNICEQIEEEGMVLLKNQNQTLPLPEMKNVTLLGSSAYPFDINGNKRHPNDRGVWGVYTMGGLIGGSPIDKDTITTTEGVFNGAVSLEQALNSLGIKCNPQLARTYDKKNTINAAPGNPYTGTQDYDNAFGASFYVNEPLLTLGECGQYNSYNDACIVIFCRTSSEGCDYYPGSIGVTGENNQTSALGLSDNERNLIKVANQISENVIVLINSAIPMEIDELKEASEISNMVDSILWIGLTGSYGMNSVARVLIGDATPSGHLPDTFAVSNSASPAAQNFGVCDPEDKTKKFTWSERSRSGYTYSDNSHYVVLAEGIYTGYYYYETRYADCVEGRGNADKVASDKRDCVSGATKWEYDKEVSYTFGYGLSYTTFDQVIQGQPVYDAKEQTLTFTVEVTNTGTYKGKSVVQLYGQAPYTDYDAQHGVEKSAISLLAFDKTDILYPLSESGADKPNSQTLTITMDLKYLASYDRTVAHDGVTGGYILEDGDYYFAIGNGAHESLNNILCKKGYTDLFLEDNVPADSEKAIKWDPKDNAITFENGINTSMFAKSENGTLVQNQMQDTDYNYFETGDTITYLSRSDYSTFPVPYVNLTLNDAMKVFLVNDAGEGGEVYQFKRGMVTTEFGIDHTDEEDEDGNPLKNLTISDMKNASYEDERWDYIVSQVTFDEAWRFCPYGGSSCNALLSVNSPEVWQIDGPNGNTTRSIGAKANTEGPMAVSPNDPNYNYTARCMPCEPIVAGTFNIELVEAEGEAFGENCLWSNNPIMWAPGMNLHRAPYNSRNHEYYSEDAMLTNILGTAFVRGGTRKGAIMSPKHFALNTQESFREGLIQFIDEQTARERELRAFQGVFEDVNLTNSAGNRVDTLGIMTTFSRIGVCGANAHTGMMVNILRGEWGFKGLSSTDMVIGGRFFNPQDCVVNNVTFMATSNADGLLANFWSEYKAKSNANTDPYFCEKLQENMHYYLYALANSHALNGYDSNTVIKNELYGWEWAIRIGAGVFGVGGLTLAGLATYMAIKNDKNAKTVEDKKTVGDKEIDKDGGNKND